MCGEGEGECEGEGVRTRHHNGARLGLPFLLCDLTGTYATSAGCSSSLRARFGLPPDLLTLAPLSLAAAAPACALPLL